MYAVVPVRRRVDVTVGGGLQVLPAAGINQEFKTLVSLIERLGFSVGGDCDGFRVWQLYSSLRVIFCQPVSIMYFSLLSVIYNFRAPLIVSISIHGCELNWPQSPDQKQA